MSEEPTEAGQDNAPAECWCIIHHPQTEEQRKAVQDALDNARATGDLNGVMLAIAQLTGPCPAWNKAR